MVCPKVYSFIELIRLILKITKRKRIIIPLNNLLSKIQAHVFQRFMERYSPWITIPFQQIVQVAMVTRALTVEEIVPKYLTKIR